MTDGIYTCDVHDYVFLLSKQDGKVTSSQQDWFYWWLRDNGIDPGDVDYVCYNELQGKIYVRELDFGHTVVRRSHGGLKCRKRGDLFVLKDYPAVELPPQILLDRWEWLMEEIRGDERALCQTG